MSFDVLNHGITRKHRIAAESAASAAAASAAQLAAGTASPAGTYANLAALNTDDPDHSKIYITLNDGNWCYHNGSEWVAGGGYQAASVVGDIASIYSLLAEKITPENTTFMKNGKNVLNPAEITYDYFMNASGTAYDSSSGLAYSGFIEVEEGDIILIQVFHPTDGIKNNFRYITAFDTNKNVLADLGLNSQVNQYTVPDGVRYLRVTFVYKWDAVIGTNLMVERTKDGVRSLYEPYRFYLSNDNIEDRSIDEAKLKSNFVKKVNGIEPVDGNVEIDTTDDFVDFIKKNIGYKELGTLPYQNNTEEKLDIIKVDLKENLGDTELAFVTKNDLNWNLVNPAPDSSRVEVTRKLGTGFLVRRTDTAAQSSSNYLYRVSFNIPVNPNTTYTLQNWYQATIEGDPQPSLFIFENGTSIGSGSRSGNRTSNNFTTGAVNEVEVSVNIGSNSSFFTYEGEIEFYDFMLINIDKWAWTDVYSPFGGTKLLQETESVIKLPYGVMEITSGNESYNDVAKLYSPVFSNEVTPNFLEYAANEMVNKLYVIQSGETVSFAFNTDIHNGKAMTTSTAHPYNRTAIENGLIALGKISESASVSYLVHGGDYVHNNQSSTTKEDCFEQFRDYRDKVSKYVGNIPQFWLRGNHDTNPVTVDYSQRINANEILVRTGKRDIKDVVINPNEKDGMYGFKDISLHNVRMIFIDNYRHKSYEDILINDHGVNKEQLHWILEHALDFSDKENANDWSIVIFTHMPFFGSFENKTELLAGLNAFKSGTSYVYDGITYDFSAQGSMQIVANIGGDVHSDRSELVDGILSISTQNASFSSFGGGLQPGAVVYDKVEGTAEETSFDIFTIDRQNNKLYATRYGAGVDREWDI